MFPRVSYRPNKSGNGSFKPAVKRGYVGADGLCGSSLVRLPSSLLRFICLLSSLHGVCSEFHDLPPSDSPDGAVSEVVLNGPILLMFWWMSLTLVSPLTLMLVPMVRTQFSLSSV